MEATVYEEWDRILVPAPGHGGAYYRVFLGTVSWTRQPEDMAVAVTVLMQDDNTEDFTEAKRKGVIHFQMPAHVLIEDLPAVTRALREMVERANAQRIGRHQG